MAVGISIGRYSLLPGVGAEFNEISILRSIKLLAVAVVVGSVHAGIRQAGRQGLLSHSALLLCQPS